MKKTALFLILVFLSGDALQAGSLKITAKKKTRESNGIASWYSRTDPGMTKYTASGQRFDDTKMTCASWQYPFGTHLKVTNLKNGKSVVCRVNDRGPAKRLNRSIDLSRAAFRKIENLKKGLVRVSVQPVYTVQPQIKIRPNFKIRNYKSRAVQPKAGFSAA